MEVIIDEHESSPSFYPISRDGIFFILTEFFSKHGSSSQWHKKQQAATQLKNSVHVDLYGDSLHTQGLLRVECLVVS